jgi:hypothetical protein
MESSMAAPAGDQCFALARCHDLDPLGLLCPSLPSEVLERSNVVHLNVFL